MPCNWIVMESAGIELSAKGVPHPVPVVYQSTEHPLDPQTFITNSCLPPILAEKGTGTIQNGNAKMLDR
jgi:hypothetical protein